MNTPTALIAEDEALLAAHLQAELARLWPDLRVVANVSHGAAAVEQSLALRPDIVFLDIRMPGMDGLEAAQAIGEDWPDGEAPPLLVFVTAYDQYALQAFEQAEAGVARWLFAGMDAAERKTLQQQLGALQQRIDEKLGQGGNS